MWVWGVWCGGTLCGEYGVCGGMVCGCGCIGCGAYGRGTECGGKLWWRYEVLGKGYGGGYEVWGTRSMWRIWVCGGGFSGRVTVALNFEWLLVSESAFTKVKGCRMELQG